MRLKYSRFLPLALPAISALVLLGCLPPQSATAWQGIQEARQQAGAPALEWDETMAGHVQKRAEYIATNHLHGHWAADEFVANYYVLEAPDTAAPICEIVAWASPEHPPSEALEHWRASPKHWACATDGRYRYAAIAQFEATGYSWDSEQPLITVVMWLRE